MKAATAARAYYFFTPMEISIARYILANQGTDRNGKPLYPPTFVTWSQKVLKWSSRYNQLLTRYALIMGDAVLAVRAIWDNLKAGYSLVKMLRLLSQRVFTFARWPRRALPAGMEHINPRSNKTARRGNVIRITERMQTRAV